MKRLILICLLMTSVAYAGFSDFGFQSFNLVGGGICRPLIPVMAVSPSSKAFGNVSTNITRSQWFTVSNTGKGSITGIQARMSSAGVFRVYSSSGTTAPMQFKTAFTPVAATAYSNAVYIDSDQFPSVRVPVSGTGTSAITYTFTTYLNADSTSTAMQKGTGTLTMGSAVTATAAQVSNGWDMGIAADSTGRVVMPTTNGNISGTEGTLSFWIKNSATAAYGTPVNWGADNLSFTNTTATNWPFVLRYKGANTASVALPVGEWHFVDLAWKSTENKAAIRIDGGAWSEITNAAGTAPSSATMAFGDVSATTKKCSFDQIIVSSTYKDENAYAKRNDTTGF